MRRKMKGLAAQIAMIAMANVTWSQADCSADINGDFVVDLDDLLVLLIHYGDSCEDATSAYPSIYISEIHYNPHSSQGNDSDWEFLELYNPNPYPLSLAQWSLNNAVELTFQAADTLPTMGYFTVARNLDSLATVLPSSAFARQWNSGQSLNNTGETIELRAPDGTVIASVSYEDNDGWVPEPDGSGPSLEWMDAGLPNDAPDSWTFSLIPGGTPGQENSMWGLSDPE